ncbi:MAG: hypothetical protein JNK85_13505 [Verrucomicrobiales bacterium]|nr:hypothetical protein [Verrucomicrobiales bacterium]
MRRLTHLKAALGIPLAGMLSAQAAIQYYPGQAIFKIYSDIPTVALSALESSPKYPNTPDEIRFVDLAETPTNIGENYGGEIEFLWTCPESGNWEFALAADDNADVWISTDESAANLKLVAREPEWNAVRSFGASTRRGCGDTGGVKPCANISDPISFTAGKRYLVRGRLKEAGGGDNWAVTAKKADGAPFEDAAEPIPGSQIGVNAENEIKALGISQSATYGYVNDTVRINASLYQPPGVTGTIEWFRDGVTIAGATTGVYDLKITDADTGGTSKNIKFKAKLTAGGKSVETAEINVLAIKRGTPVLSPGFVTVEFFNEISGTAVQGLYEADKYINNQPDETRVLAALDTPNGYAENYGARVTGFILPQETGQYRFFIRSDDASELYLNTTAGGAAPVPGSDTPIAQETGCCDAFHEADGSPETSEPVNLTAGQRYAFVAIIKEGGGGDYLQVAWRKEGDTTAAGSLQPMRGPIIGGLTETNGFSVTLTQQPQAPPAPGVVEGSSYTLRGAAAVVPNPAFLYYQWMKDGAAIPGANSSSFVVPANTPVGNYKYKLRAYTVGGMFAESAEINVPVVPDTFPPVPQLGVVKKGNGFEIGVGFNEAVDAATASVQANYSVSPGTIGSFRFVPQSGHAVITVNGVNAGSSVAVTVKNVKDLKGNAISASGATANVTIASKFAWVGVGGNEANSLKNSTKFVDDAVALSDKDFDLVSGGTAHWANYDEQTFVYEEITGDFDVKVRVEFQTASSQWARSGLQFRETLDEGVTREQLWNADSNPSGVKMSQNFSIRVNPTVGVDRGDGTTTPGNNSYEQVHRPRAGFNYDGFNTIYNISSGFGGAPPYPNAWMRLKREGQKITAWRSSDGSTWEGGATVTYTDDPETEENELLADKLYVGPFYAPELSNNDILTNDLMTESGVAKFREYGPVGGGGGGGTPTIAVVRDGANLKITYTGTLQGADDVTGPYSDVAAATSPATIATSAARKFYRAKN